MTIETYDYDLTTPDFEDVGGPDTRPLWARNGIAYGQSCIGLSPSDIREVLAICSPKDDDVVVIKAAGTTESGRRHGFNDMYVSQIFVNSSLVGTYTY